MTTSSGQLDPFDVVARALACPRDSMSIESAMYKDHGWDSFGHVSVIVALEEAYGVNIPNDDVLKLKTMAAIVDYSERLQETSRREK